MMKMKGVLAIDASRLVYDDPRVGSFKHQSLFQDYQALEQETNAKKERLDRAKLKKLTLLAEVSFLRKRYKFLMENQSANPHSEPDHVQTKNLIARTKNTGKQKKAASLLPLVPRSNTHQKGRIYSGNESTLRDQSPSFDLNRKDMVSNRKEAGVLNSAPTLDLNQNVMGARENDYSRKEVTIQKKTPVFDLNQISREEEELHFDEEPLIIDEVDKSSIRAFSKEQHNDMKLSICRTMGNGSTRAGKRKISWKDQVVLRV